MSTTLVLLSGGLDSAVCAHLLKSPNRQVEGLFVDYGQAALERERTSAQAVAAHLGIPLRMRAIQPAPARGTGELPGRNALLISLAVFELGTEGGLVAIGVHAGTRYFDCSEAFVDAMGRLVQEQTDGRTALSAPLVCWSKSDVFRVFREIGLAPSETYSCEAGPTPCGVCLSCADRTVLEC